jgi:quercetin dioxygenase-like cupin family protein
VLLCAAVCLACLTAQAQDPVKVDAKHYKVVFENAEVRVLKITYGPKEKSVMHHHPAAVAVFHTDQNVKFHKPDGTSEVIQAKAGDAIWTAEGSHLPENLSDKPLELILVELKGRRAGGAAAPAKKSEAKK